MACIEDQKSNFKHYCRVCKKGFMCGRALGGHMRAHGIGYENGNLNDNDDRVSDWEEKRGGDDRPDNKRMYQLRTNPNRLKSCRKCEHSIPQYCGMEFLSWKSFLEHGKCSAEGASESFVSSPECEGEFDVVGRDVGWSKPKRSLRTKVSTLSSAYPTIEEEDEDLVLARCLVQLANTIVDPSMVKPEESCASASREEERQGPFTFFSPSKAKGLIPSPKNVFECKACKMVLNSHQALGGHRASHKKVKGCYASKLDQAEDNNFGANEDVITHEEFFPPKSTSTFQFENGSSLVGDAKRKSKVHECSICHRVFSSGQALGGHKRCHWIVSNSSTNTSPLVKFQFLDQQIHQHDQHKPNNEKSEGLDLNVSAWAHLWRDPQNPLSFDMSTGPHVDPWTSCEVAITNHAAWYSPH